MRFRLVILGLLAAYPAGASAGGPGRYLWRQSGKLADHLATRADAAAAKGRPRVAAAGRAGSACARLVRDMVGETAIEVGFGVRGYVRLPSIPGAPGLINDTWERGLNAGPTAQRFWPSLGQRERGEVLHTRNIGLVLQTPLLMGGLMERGGITGGLHPPGFAALVNGKYFELDLGAPGVFTLGVGHDRERGPYVLHHLGLKLPFIPQWGPAGVQANFRLHLYNPRFDGLVRRARPTAVRVQDMSIRMNRTVSGWARRVLGRPLPDQPDVPRDPN